MSKNIQNSYNLPYEVGEFNNQRYDNMATLENNVLGFCLVKSDTPYYWDKILPRFRADEFVAPFHQAIWSAVVTLNAKETSCNVVNVADQLEQIYEGKDVQVLDPHTGESHPCSVRRLLMDTMDLAVMSEEAWEDAVKSLRRYMDAQILFTISENVKTRLFQCDDLNDILADTQKALADLDATQNSTILDPIHLGVSLYDFLDSKQVGNVPTGLKDWDRLLDGGMLNSGLYILAARPGVGKTTFGLHIADYAAEHTGNVLFVTLKMDKEQIQARRVAQLTGIPATKNT